MTYEEAMIFVTDRFHLGVQIYISAQPKKEKEKDKGNGSSIS